MTGDKRDYLLLSPAELRMYDLVLSQLIFMDSLQTNNLMDNINPYITASEVNACLSRQSYEEANHCLIEGTEILTDRGFIDFRELTYEDKVANYYHNGRIFFNYPKEIIHNKFKGDLIEFSMHNYKQIVTPNHRMVMRYPYYKRVKETDRGKIKMEVAEDASLGNYDIPVAGYNIGPTSTLNIVDRLGIIYQADGTPVNNFNNTKHGYCYRFSFKREDKINRLNQILNSNGIKHTKKISDSGYTHFYVWINFKYDKEFSWITIEDKSSEYISSFMEELGYWDGSIRRKANNNILYTNTNRKAVDKVIALATIGGCQTGVYRMEPSDNNYNKITAYQVYIAIGKDHKTGREINKSRIPYDGMTYCCTVDSGMIICRYEDSVFVTGNSKSYAVMVESISDNTDLIYDMWKTDDKLREKNTYIASVYEELTKGDLTDTKLLLALFANQILEGIYFYAGFAALYALGKSGKMLGTAQMIRFVQRDEVVHLLLFQNMINSVRKERPELFTSKLETKVRDMFRKAVKLEASWGAYITQGQILGFTDGIIEQYIQYLADRRLEAVGYKAEYNVKHPIPWVDGYASFNSQRTNFFEGSVANYSKGSISFDDF